LKESSIEGNTVEGKAAVPETVPETFVTTRPGTRSITITPRSHHE
jgi:hypothetical protein